MDLELDMEFDLDLDTYVDIDLDMESMTNLRDSENQTLCYRPYLIRSPWDVWLVQTCSLCGSPEH